MFWQSKFSEEEVKNAMRSQHTGLNCFNGNFVPFRQRKLSDENALLLTVCLGWYMLTKSVSFWSLGNTLSGNVTFVKFGLWSVFFLFFKKQLLVFQSFKYLNFIIFPVTVKRYDSCQKRQVWHHNEKNFVFFPTI